MWESPLLTSGCPFGPKFLIEENTARLEPENAKSLRRSNTWLANKEQKKTKRGFSPYFWRLSDVDPSTNDPSPGESLVQTELALGDLRRNLVDQQDARTQSEDKYKLALVELEKLKAELERTQADQSAALKRAKKAEAKLATVQQELSGLKRHISNMTRAIFGSRVANLQDDCVLMLKAIYTLTELLYTGSVLTVKAVIGAKEPMTSIKKVLGYLSTLPPQIGELTRSAARKGVLTALSRCLVYAPEINLEEVAAGFPQLKDDGSEFVEEDYQKVVKDSRWHNSTRRHLDLTKYR
ncbi:hypothetical protein ZWY2020_037874 [Hordeum vulgare]|nr:hypothetical protein ZWY2020_037874 [Hordeum vulgare]